MVWCSGSSINSGDSSYKIQAFYDDCEGTGRRYASLQHKVLVSPKTPLGIRESIIIRIFSIFEETVLWLRIWIGFTVDSVGS
jgi:hypothetical protein